MEQSDEMPLKSSKDMQGSDLDTVLDACLGFGLSIGTMAYLILHALLGTSSYFGGSSMAVITALVAAGVFVVIQH